MAGSSNDPAEDGAIRSPYILHRIAAALGEPIAAFTEGTASRADLVDTCELLRIWQGLERAADRRKALAFARSLNPQA